MGLLCAIWPANSRAQTVGATGARGKIAGGGTSDSWSREIADGLAAYNQARYADARGDFSAALKQAEAVDPKGSQVADAANDLGAVYYSEGNYAAARPLFEQALAIRRASGESDEASCAAIEKNLGEIDLAQGQYGAAEELFQRVRAIDDETRGVDSLESAAAAQGLGEALLADAKYAAAGQALDLTLRAREKLLGENDPAIAQTLRSKALLLSVTGKNAEAKEVAQRALSIDERRGRDDLMLTNDLTVLAHAESELSDNRAAVELLERALKIQRKHLRPDDPGIALVLTNLASAYCFEGKYGEAQKLFGSALGIAERSGNQVELAQVLSDQAAALERQHRYKKALPLYQRALSIREEALGPDHLLVAEAEYGLAAAYLANKQYDESEVLLRNALAIWEKTLGPNHPHVAAALTALGRIYAARKQYEEAETSYQKSLDIERAALGSVNPAIADTLDFYAALLRMLNRRPEAEVLAARAMVMRAQWNERVEQN